ncbi:MAG: 50S ribosomal protein L14e [archaeon]
MEIGQVCIKTRGREAGKKVVIISEAKAGKVLTDGPNTKRKLCNVLHLFPLMEKVNIKKDASHEEVVKALK